MLRCALSLLLSTVLLACGSTASTSAGSAATADTALDSAADASADTATDTVAPVDSAGDATSVLGSSDVAGDATTGPDVASTMANCTFNADCIATERCECSESAGCFCKVGPRGTGKSGVDTCKVGEDCETALCMEGPVSEATYYCSGPCKTAQDCGPKLPICANIAFLGKVCIRDPKATP